MRCFLLIICILSVSYSDKSFYYQQLDLMMKSTYPSYYYSAGLVTYSSGTLIREGQLMKLKPLSAKLKKWPNTLKQFVGNFPTICLSVFGHFVGLAFKGLK